MTTTDATCRACHKVPAPDAFCCWPCADRAVADLRLIARDVDALEVRGATGPAAGAPDSRPPVPDHVVDVRGEIRTALVGTARVVAEQTGTAPPAALDVAGLARWLVGVVDHLRLAEYGPDEFATFARCAARIQAITRPPRRTVWLGRCTGETDDGACQRDLYAPADDHGRPEVATIRCRCGNEVDVQERRTMALGMLADHVAPVSELARWLAGMASRSTLDRAIRKGVIEPAGTVLVPIGSDAWREVDGYRLGDALAVVA